MQCQGITQSGHECRNYAGHHSNFCHMHNKGDQSGGVFGFGKRQQLEELQAQMDAQAPALEALNEECYQ